MILRTFVLAVALGSFGTQAFLPISSSISATTSPLSANRQDEDFSIDRRSAIAGAVGASLSLKLPWNNNIANAEAPRTVPTLKFDNGVQFPTLALNTVGLTADDTERALQYATKEGITHVDFHPGKERDGVAQYLKNNPGAKLFLNTKIRKAPPGTSAEDAAERARQQIDEDFKALGVNQVDMLMLRDSPDCDVMQAQWAVLEDALAQGKTRSLGVINYCQKSLSCLLKTAKVKPDVHYYMLHLGMTPDPRGLRTFGESRGIRTFAYGAVGEPGPNEQLLKDVLVNKIAKAHNKSPEEVALRWVLQTGAAVSVRPTLEFDLGVSACRDDFTCEKGMKARAQTLDWALTFIEMEKLSGLTKPDDNPTLFSSSGCPDAFVMPSKK